MEPEMVEAMDRPDEEIKRLNECQARDACERDKCSYFNDPEDIRKVLEYIGYLERYVKELEDDLQQYY